MDTCLQGEKLVEKFHFEDVPTEQVNAATAHDLIAWCQPGTDPHKA
jgi:hypothetical protein